MKRSSSNILALADIEHTPTVANSSTHIQCMTRTRAAIPAAVTGGNWEEKPLKKENNKHLNQAAPVGTTGRTTKRETFCKADPLVHHDKAGRSGNGYFRVASTRSKGVTGVLQFKKKKKVGSQ